ncbi:50S ribosomal protein L6 [Buchnera aphidicola]|uniref:50S ribosomal protein L6 n=1 Tax=Buchnera aphidicola TaxID=9 RepID=UPI003463F98B
MSRIAKKLIVIPSSVDVILKENNITITCNEKSLTHHFHNSVIIKFDDNKLFFQSRNNKNYGWMQAGTVRSLVHSMILGVTTGFTKKLSLIGVGYRVNIEKNNIISMYLGYSHVIKYHLPDEIKINSTSSTEMILYSFDKQLLGQVAANLRKKRKPESYKGKGIRYFNEKIRIKEAKKK